MNHRNGCLCAGCVGARHQSEIVEQQHHIEELESVLRHARRALEVSGFGFESNEVIEKINEVLNDQH